MTQPITGMHVGAGVEEHELRLEIAHDLFELSLETGQVAVIVRAARERHVAVTAALLERKIVLAVE